MSTRSMTPRFSLLLVGALGAIGFVATRAYGTLGQAGLETGRALAPLGADGATSLKINEQTLKLTPTSSSHSVRDLLDDSEKECEPLLGTGALRGPRSLRYESDTEGMLACFHDAPHGQQFTSRVRRFAETHDLADLGALRYFYAQKRGPKEVLLLRVEADGPLGLRNLFPRDLDAPGGDPTVAARPDNSRRLLVVRSDSHAHALWIYEVAGSRADALRLYDDAMRKRGAFAVEPPAKQPGDEAHGYLTKSEVQVMVSALQDGDRTRLTIAEMGRGPEGAVRAAAMRRRE